MHAERHPAADLSHLLDEADVERLRARLHDTTLQTLEFIATGGMLGNGADLDELMRLAAREATELREYLEGLIEKGSKELAESLQEAIDRERCLSPQDINLVLGQADGSVRGIASTDLVAAVRETLTNARKHSRASEVTIYLEERSGAAQITVTDDGVGADLAQLTPRLGMRHSLAGRMSRMGGAFHIESSPGEGMTVTLKLGTPRGSPVENPCRRC